MSRRRIPRRAPAMGALLLAGCTAWRQGPNLEPRRNWPTVIELRQPTTIASGGDTLRDVVRLKGDVTRVRQSGDTIDVDLEYARATSDPVSSAPGGELRKVRVKVPRSAVLQVGQPRYSLLRSAELTGVVLATAAVLVVFDALWAIGHTGT